MMAESEDRPKTVRVSTVILFSVFVLLIYVYVLRWQHVHEVDVAQAERDKAKAALNDCRVELANPTITIPRMYPEIRSFNCKSALSALMGSLENWQRPMLEAVVDDCT